MTQKTAIELARYYLTSHGADCYTTHNSCFEFQYEGYKFCLSCWGSIDIGPIPGRWLYVDLKYFDVDETNPIFDPEKYFEPFLDKLNEHIEVV